MTHIRYPQYISTKVTGDDEIKGKSHTKLAKIIAQTIREENLERKVIGLEGEWGAGKSNLIEILNNQLGENYHFFIFDAWGSQEDLTRKSFLEQLLESLFNKGLIIRNSKWEEIETSLQNKTQVSTTNRFPQLKVYWIFFTLAIFSFAISNGFYDIVLKNQDLISSIDFGIWKGIIAVFLLPSVFGVLGLILAIKSYKKERQIDIKNSTANSKKKPSRTSTLAKILYWSKGTNLNTTEVQKVVMEEPSVQKFRNYLKDIAEDFPKNQNLVIVFDNLDRLEQDKLKMLWSSIHTFFAIDDQEHSLWVIIPYSFEQLKIHMPDYKSFVEKTFSLRYQVNPPIVQSSDDFLRKKLGQAFGSDLIPKEDMVIIQKLFDLNYLQSAIKPRQVINFTNNLVSLYKQWEAEIRNEELKFRYLALFIFSKEELLFNSGKAIIQKKYFKIGQYLFDEDPHLEISIAMLVFGVEKSMAKEILLHNEIKKSLRTGDVETIKNLSDKEGFSKYFEEAYDEVELPQKIKSLPKVFEVIENTFSPLIMKKRFWNNFASGIQTLKDQQTTFTDTHKKILLKSSPQYGKGLVEELCLVLSNKVQSPDDEIVYYENISDLRDFLTKHSLKYPFQKYLKFIQFETSNFLKVIEIERENYTSLRINTNEEELIRHYAKGEKMDLKTMAADLDLLKIVHHKVSLKTLTSSVYSQIGQMNYGEIDALSAGVKILHEVRKSPLELKLSQSFYHNLNSQRLSSKKQYLDAFCIAISDFENAKKSQAFNLIVKKSNPKLAEQLAERIEIFMSLEQLFQLMRKFANPTLYPLFKEIIQWIIQSPTTNFHVDVNYVLQNANSIFSRSLTQPDHRKKLFDLIAKKKVEITMQPYEVSPTVYKLMGYSQNSIISEFIQKSIDYLMGLNPKDWIQIFKTPNQVLQLTQALLEYEQLDKLPDSFYESYNLYMREIVEEKHSVDNNSFWSAVRSYMNKVKLKSIYTGIRDHLVTLEKADPKVLAFFASPLMEYGNLDKKTNAFDKLFPQFLQHNNILSELLVRTDQLYKIIQASPRKTIYTMELEQKRNIPVFNETKLNELTQLLKEN